MNRAIARAAQPQYLLTRILEQPDLVSVVQSLDAPVLGRLINQIGLEDSGELVALATTQQLQGIFEDDLWRSEQPGRDEKFDAGRFALWLEVMLETGPAFTAEKLAELDEDLVTLALCKHVLVVYTNILAEGLWGASDVVEEVDLTGKALESCLYQEFEEFQIIARDPDSWDPIISVLAELDRNHHDYFRGLLERCQELCAESIEDNGGLYQVLTSEDMLEGDVAAKREDRREQKGFVAPSLAASFLELARVTSLDEIASAREPDPVTHAYFRAYVPERNRTVSSDDGGRGRDPKVSVPPPTRLAEFIEVLRDADVLPRASVPLLGGAKENEAEQPPLFQRAIGSLRDLDPDLYERLLKEASYLANVLISGCSIDGRAFRPLEATEAVVAVCNLGLEYLMQQRPEIGAEKPPDRRSHDLEARAAARLAREGSVKMFRIGWHRLHHGVSLFAAGVLLERIEHLVQTLPARDRDLANHLGQVGAVLRKGIAAGTPWLARTKLELLEGPLDSSAVSALRALLDECPTRPTPLPGRTVGRDHAFVSTEAEIRAAQELVKGFVCGFTVASVK